MILEADNCTEEFIKELFNQTKLFLRFDDCSIKGLLETKNHKITLEDCDFQAIEFLFEFPFEYDKVYLNVQSHESEQPRKSRIRFEPKKLATDSL